MKYVFKHSKEIEQKTLDGHSSKDRQEGIFTLDVRLERVSEGASVELIFGIAHGSINFEMQEIITQTTGLIDAALKALEAQRS